VTLRSFSAALTLSMALLASLLLSSGTVYAADLVVGEGAVVTADRLNLRGGPSTGNPIVGSLTQDTAVRLLAGPVNDGWWRVTDGTCAGYVNEAWLIPSAAPDGAGSFDLDLPIPFHRQMTAVWCEPADIQSWTEYARGESLSNSYAVQQSIWNWELSHNAGYTEDPVEPAHPLPPPRRPASGCPTAASTTSPTTTRWPPPTSWPGCWRAPSTGSHPIALVWRGEHYILVRGVRATADPSVDPLAKILGVYVMDPNQGSRSWLGEDRYIPIEEWVTHHLTPVTYLTPHTGMPGDPWQDKCVTIQRDWEDDGPTTAGRLNATTESYETAGR